MQTTTPPPTPAQARHRLGGVIAAALTPFTDTLTLDRPALEAHVAGLIADGCDYVSLFGTSGEGAALESATKIAWLDALFAGGMDPARILPAVMTTDLAAARRMLRFAAEAGCPAALVVPPFYYPASEDGVLEFYQSACGEGDPGIDIVLYHIPALSRFAFSHELIARLGDVLGGRLAGVKDSTGDQAHTLALARAFPDLAIFTGTDTDLLPLLEAGGAGIIGGLPNINARGLATVVRGTGAERDAAYELASRLLRLVEDGGGIAALKALVAERTGNDAWLRMTPPLRPLPAADRVSLAAAARAAGLDLSRQAA